MKISLSGLLLRLKISGVELFSIKEFLSNFKEAKKAFFEGDLETVKEFFELYIVK